MMDQINKQYQSPHTIKRSPVSPMMSVLGHAANFICDSVRLHINLIFQSYLPNLRQRKAFCVGTYTCAN